LRVRLRLRDFGFGILEFGLRDRDQEAGARNSLKKKK
jgi:hypothetical protein